MKTVLQIVASLALSALIVSTLVLTKDVHDTLRQTKQTLAAVQTTTEHLQGTSDQLGTTLATVGHASEELNLAAQEQRAYWLKTSAESAKAMRDLRQLTARLDRSINDHLLPDFDDNTVKTSLAAQQALESVRMAADTLNFQLRDPALSQMAEHLNDAAAGLAETSKHAATATDHMEGATADIQQAVHRLTRPASLAKRIGITLLDVGSKLGNIVAGFFK